MDDDKVDVLRVCSGLLRLYEQKAVLWDKLSRLDQEIRELRGLVAPETLKKKGI